MVLMASEGNHPRDPSGIDQPHDVLAAEEFAMPTRDNRFPADPIGTTRPHDVLAAEEFGMPLPAAETDWTDSPSDDRLRLLAAAAAGFLLAVVLLRHR